MLLLKRFYTTLFIITCIHQVDAQKINSTSPAEGAIIVYKPLSYKNEELRHGDIKDFTADALVDERIDRSWKSDSITKFPYNFVVELSGKYMIQSLFFNNAVTTAPYTSAKKVEVSFSTSSKDTGFTEPIEIVLKEKDTLNYNLRIPIDARWIKVSVLSNYGNKSFVELSQFKAIGLYKGKWPRSESIQGYWESNWGWLCVQKLDDGTYGGHYEFRNGKILNGKVRRGRYFSFQWNELENGGDEGWAKLVLNEESEILSGIWGTDGRDNQGIWKLSKNKDSVEKCPVIDLLPDEKKTKKSYVELRVHVISDSVSKTPVPKAQLKIINKDDIGHIGAGITQDKGLLALRLPNDNFEIIVSKEGMMPCTYDFNSLDYIRGKDTTIDIFIELRAPKVGESIPLKNVSFARGKSDLESSSNKELNRLVTMLKQHPDMKIELSGHTDNRGSTKLNQKLSEDRVASVKKYLVSKGIKRSRIVGKGYGGSKPIADNRTEETRKLNRRVEFKILEF